MREIITFQSPEDLTYTKQNAEPKQKHFFFKKCNIYLTSSLASKY